VKNESVANEGHPSTCPLDGVVSFFFDFHPYNGEDSDFDSYFARWLKAPTRSTIFSIRGFGWGHLIGAPHGILKVGKTM